MVIRKYTLKQLLCDLDIDFWSTTRYRLR